MLEKLVKGRKSSQWLDTGDPVIIGIVYGRNSFWTKQVITVRINQCNVLIKMDSGVPQGNETSPKDSYY